MAYRDRFERPTPDRFQPGEDSKFVMGESTGDYLSGIFQSSGNRRCAAGQGSH
jgi:hypothetical protein